MIFDDHNDDFENIKLPTFNDEYLGKQKRFSSFTDSKSPQFSELNGDLKKNLNDNLKKLLKKSPRLELNDLKIAKIQRKIDDRSNYLAIRRKS